MSEIPEEIYEAALPCITDPCVAEDSYRDVVDEVYPLIAAHVLYEATQILPLSEGATQEIGWHAQGFERRAADKEDKE